ncbi:MAG: response regulator transcription factor [Anaerolineae bacterium]|nr:response regulator transcription factor [Anaerolineae bacterium]
MSKQRILVIDDDAKLTHLLDIFLSKNGYDISVANLGRDGLQLAYKLHPDLVILDVMMPGMDGWTTCERLREVSDVPIIMLTARGTEEDIVGGLERGADDYIVKPFRVAELLARIKAVLRRKSGATDIEDLQVFSNGELTINYSKREVTVRGEMVNLTPTEYDLLVCLARNQGRVLPREMLLSQVWGDEYVEATQYLKLYIRYLRQKLEKDPSHPEFILTEWGVGYRFEGK